MKRLIQKAAVCLALPVVPAVAAALIFVARGRGEAEDLFVDHSVSLSEIGAWKQPILWVDARSTTEWQAEHVPGAVALNEDDWAEQIPTVLGQWKPGCWTVVYCRSQQCHSSEDVARRLRREVGLSPVFVLRGGWEAWKGARK